MEDRYTLTVNFGGSAIWEFTNQDAADIVTICFQKWYRNDLFWYVFIDLHWFFAYCLFANRRFLRYKKTLRHGICKGSASTARRYFGEPISTLVLTVHFKNRTFFRETHPSTRPILGILKKLTGSDGSIRDLQKQLEESETTSHQMITNSESYQQCFFVG